MHASWQAGELGVGGTSWPEGNRVSLTPEPPLLTGGQIQELGAVLLPALGWKQQQCAQP